MSVLDTMNIQATLIAFAVYAGLVSWHANKWVSGSCFASSFLVLNNYIKFAIILAVKGPL